MISMTPSRPRIYGCSPYSARPPFTVDDHRRWARALARYLLDAGAFPVVPHLFLTQFLDDTVPEEREVGLTIGLELLESTQGMAVLHVPLSAGMAQEVAHATARDIPLRWVSLGRLGMTDLTPPQDLAPTLAVSLLEALEQGASWGQLAQAHRDIALEQWFRWGPWLSSRITWDHVVSSGIA